MHDNPQTFLTVVDKMIVHSLVLHDVAICVFLDDRYDVCYSYSCHVMTPEIYSQDFSDCRLRLKTVQKC